MSLETDITDTIKTLQIEQRPFETIRYAVNRKLKLRNLGYIYTAVIYGNVMVDGETKRKRIEVVSKFPIGHLHHAYLYDTFTPRWQKINLERELQYLEKYMKVGWKPPVFKGVPSYDYNIFTWGQVMEGKYYVHEDVAPQWVEYEQKS